MYEHYQHLDAYYAEQAMVCCAGCDLRREVPQEIVIPLRWIAIWFAAVSGCGFGIAALINWLF